jgi:hypothetical protein
VLLSKKALRLMNALRRFPAPPSQPETLIRALVDPTAEILVHRTTVAETPMAGQIIKAQITRTQTPRAQTPGAPTIPAETTAAQVTQDAVATLPRAMPAATLMAGLKTKIGITPADLKTQGTRQTQETRGTRAAARTTAIIVRKTQAPRRTSRLKRLTATRTELLRLLNETRNLSLRMSAVADPTPKRPK